MVGEQAEANKSTTEAGQDAEGVNVHICELSDNLQRPSLRLIVQYPPKLVDFRDGVEQKQDSQFLILRTEAACELSRYRRLLGRLSLGPAGTSYAVYDFLYNDRPGRPVESLAQEGEFPPDC